LPGPWTAAFIASKHQVLNPLVPYLLLLALALPFRGMSQDQTTLPPDHLSPDGFISIGLLLPDQSYSEVAKAARLAIEEANKGGGYKQLKFELVIRTAEGFWGAGSKESVGLVYKDHVRAIIGHLDGRNGHLAEQVAAKSHLTYVETFATEPTLSQAFVPWFMRVVPNENQQSAAILDQILREGGGKIGLLSIDNYDTRYAVRSLTKAVARENGMAPIILEPDTAVIHQRKVIEQILSSNMNHLVIPFDADYLGDLIMTLRQLKPDLKIYGNLHFTMGVEKRSDNWEEYEGIYMIAPLFNREKHPDLPDMRSAYMYDAVRLVVNAIQKAGTERVSITEYISASDFPHGVTGSISFDELGNRQNSAGLIHIENGIPTVKTPPRKP
jgi:branched-chain amino acid transport system substrate-binding protein